MFFEVFLREGFDCLCCSLIDLIVCVFSCFLDFFLLGGLGGSF